MGCPCSFSHEFVKPSTLDSIKGKYLVYARLKFNVDTREIEVNETFYSLKRALFDGGYVKHMPSNCTSQIFIMHTEEDYNKFLKAKNFENGSEWYKAISKFMLDDYSQLIGEPWQDFLARISTM